jgi:hypothetical protein
MVSLQQIQDVFSSQNSKLESEAAIQKCRRHAVCAVCLGAL